jgi:hypothetical protein
MEKETGIKFLSEQVVQDGDQGERERERASLTFFFLIEV